MIATATMLLSLLLTQVFEVASVPFVERDAHCFVAEWNGDGKGDFFLIDGHTLKVLQNGAAAQRYSIHLDAGVSAFDIVDVNDDRLSDVIAISGDDILLYEHPPSPLSGDAQANPAKLLFSLNTHFSATDARPFPHVLSVQRDDRTLLCLPTEDGLELRSLEGDVVEVVPAQNSAHALAGYTQSFSGLALRSDAPELRPSIEFRVNRLLAPNPFPTDTAIEEPMRRGTPRQAQQAQYLGPEAWPWFALRTDGVQGGRALYALTGPQHPETLVRIRAPASEQSKTPGILQIGPIRHYPGALIGGPSELPDFNGDGFVDLILWKAPQPVPTIDAMTKALIRGDWPIRITVHLFSEETGRFVARPADFMQRRVPFTQILLRNNATVPLRLVVMEDFNGDGRTDFACATAPDTFEVWLFGEEGFQESPDFHYTFPTPIHEIAFRADLEGNAKISLGLRGERVLYVLNAN